jgi:hypothetical protein
MKASHSGVASHRRTQRREILQQIDMIEEAHRQSAKWFWMILPGPQHDLFKVS